MQSMMLIGIGKTSVAPLHAFIGSGAEQLGCILEIQNINLKKIAFI